jgi:hypothetical protein
MICTDISAPSQVSHVRYIKLKTWTTESNCREHNPSVTLRIEKQGN